MLRDKGNERLFHKSGCWPRRRTRGCCSGSRGPGGRSMMPCARASCVVFVSSFNNVTTITITTALSGGPAFRVAVCFTRHSPTKREDVFVRPYFCLRRILRCYRLLTAIVAVCREKLARYHYLLILPSTGISRSINKGLWIWNENLNERTPFISLRFLETLTMSAHMEGGGGATVMDTMWTRGCREQSARIYIIGPYELGFPLLTWLASSMNTIRAYILTSI